MLHRAAPLLVVAALASGCVLETRPGAGGVAIYWAFWSSSLGNIGDVTIDGATTICTTAGVHDVRIWLTDPAGDSFQPSDGPCIESQDTPGAAFGDLMPGTWSYVLEGRRGGLVVYQASGTFDVAVDERTLVDVRATPPSGNWDAVVSYTAACGVGTRLAFSLYEVVGGSRVERFGTDSPLVNPPVALDCAASGTFTVPSVRPGAYAFSDWVELDAGGSPAGHWSVCRPTWTQGNSGNSTLSVDVTATTAPPADNSGNCI